RLGVIVIIGPADSTQILHPVWDAAEAGERLYNPFIRRPMHFCSDYRRQYIFMVVPAQKLHIIHTYERSVHIGYAAVLYAGSCFTFNREEFNIDGVVKPVEFLLLHAVENQLVIFPRISQK